LIREDDNDNSEGEEEERINMTVNTTADDRMRRRVEFHAAQEVGMYWFKKCWNVFIDSNSLL
jgi:hypothetical protein